MCIYVYNIRCIYIYIHSNTRMKYDDNMNILYDYSRVMSNDVFVYNMCIYIYIYIYIHIYIYNISKILYILSSHVQWLV